MAALDFPNSPTTNQQYAAPNGVTYQWDGAVWVVTGGPPGQLWTGGTGTLTPTDTTKRVVIPGPTAGGADMAPVVVGSRTMKGRQLTLPSLDEYALTYNGWFDGTSWHADDSTKPVWQTVVGASPQDVWLITRAVGTTPGTGVQLLVLDANGSLALGNTGGTMRAHFGLYPAGGGLLLFANADPWTNAIDNTALPQWNLMLGQSDQLNVQRSPAGSSVSYTALFSVNSAGNLTIFGPTATKASGTTWANPSDRRLKDEIADYVTGLAAIRGLTPRTFVYNGKAGSTAGMRGYGFIADEVAPVMPEMVGTTTTKLNTDDAEETEIQTLDTSNLVLALTNAVKELAARLATVETQCLTPQPAPAAS